MISSKPSHVGVQRYQALKDAEKTLDDLRHQLAELYRKQLHLAERGEDTQDIENLITSKRIEVAYADRLVISYELSSPPSKRRIKAND